MIAATQLKVGMVIMHNGKPHRVTNVLHVTPGNWRGMVQTRLVNIETGSNAAHRFRSEDKVDRAPLEEQPAPERDRQEAGIVGSVGGGTRFQQHGLDATTAQRERECRPHRTTARDHERRVLRQPVHGLRA